MMRVLVTGSEGFIGKNLLLHLQQREGVEIVTYTRNNTHSELLNLLDGVDFIFHLAGVNRPENPSEFDSGNTGLSAYLAEAMISLGCEAPIVYTSSIQAELENPYGLSKRKAEDLLLDLRESAGIPVTVFRLPNVFGKWARPNYNSVVATFCYNIANKLPINIHDPSAIINLVYIDDVVEKMLSIMDAQVDSGPYFDVSPVHQISIGDLADQLYRFQESRSTLITEPVGTGLIRALHSTYLSYLPKESFSYSIPKYGDERGVFVEMLKTPTSGQFSFFTAHPGITRGGHYHHSKTEKFLVIKGKARFNFRHMVTNEFYEVITSGDQPEIVETIPGWTHDITNIGDDEMLVMLWANEIFDRNKPDTYACPLN